MNQQRRHRAAQRFVATARGGGNDFAVEQQAHFEAVAIAETMHAHVRGECALQRAGIGTLSVVTAAWATAHGEQAFVFEDACRLLHGDDADAERSEEHTSELQSLMRISYAVFCLKKKKNKPDQNIH